MGVCGVGLVVGWVDDGVGQGVVVVSGCGVGGGGMGGC